MAEINVDHINPFLMAASTIMRDACQMEMKIGKPYVKTPKACQVASGMMMGMPVPELDDMAMSAISELGNMIMGNAATILSTKGIGIDITPPTVCRGAMKISQSYAKNICIPMSCNDDLILELDIAVKGD